MPCPLAIVTTVLHRTLDQLVLDYIVNEGYSEPAEHFIEATGITSTYPSPRLTDEECLCAANGQCASIAKRVEIREAVQAGRIREAVRTIGLG